MSKACVVHFCRKSVSKQAGVNDAVWLKLALTDLVARIVRAHGERESLARELAV